MSGSGRPGIRKSLRFDIFHSDGFTCQYCGSRPPDVVLELDHILPVSAGGTDEECNLTTSCQDCNRGKSNKILGCHSQAPDMDLQYLKAEQERAEISRYLAASKAREQAVLQVIRRIQDVWANCFHTKKVPSDSVVKGWLVRSDPEVIELAIEAAIPAFHADRIKISSFNKMLAYVSAIMRNMNARDGEAL